jgi:hypothetical protein
MTRPYGGNITDADIKRLLGDYCGGLRSRSIAQLTMCNASDVRKHLADMEKRGIIRKCDLYPTMREHIWLLA